MNQAVFNDKQTKPTDEMVFSAIGDTALLWKQTFSYLFDNHSNVSVIWKYSICGKYWVCQALQKKKSLFRIHIPERNYFTISFPLGDHAEQAVQQSKLPDNIKQEFIDAKRYSTTRYITLKMEDSRDFENVKMLIELKLRR